jgi:lipoprotein-anchoring transpeptidase ErfK/SrfK
VARFPSNSYGRRRGRNLKLVYGVSALFIIAAVISFIYGRPFGKDEEAIPAGIANISVEKRTTPPAVSLPKPAPNRIVEPNVPKITPRASSEANASVAEIIEKAVALIDVKPARIIEARDILNDALLLPMDDVQRALIKKRLSELADKWLFSRTVYPQDQLCSNYDVKPGELLRQIGAENKVPWEFLQEINNISRPELLKSGSMIKVVHGPFHARVYRSTFTMDVYLQRTFVRSFPVGLGQSGRETPTGLWCVKEGGKLIKPPWSDPETGKLLNYGDPGYALGSRWIALEGIKGDAKDRTGFGIHGTVEPETIGTKSSKGCIRLHNGDVIKVYNLLSPVHSLVRVVD